MKAFTVDLSNAHSFDGVVAVFNDGFLITYLRIGMDEAGMRFTTVYGALGSKSIS